MIWIYCDKDQNAVFFPFRSADSAPCEALVPFNLNISKLIILPKVIPPHWLTERLLITVN